MVRDNVTFRFNIDMTQMTVKGRQAIKILEDIELKSGKAGAGMTRMGASAARAGQQTAASAVNFQTATQGMLNLSTAAVQTYTSISNLDRANNRAKMSVIAVARAEDLLNNKRQRLNDMTDAGITSGGKYANMQREIATATADLTVKQEKQKIEQAAVNDIYMLFATNIANVTISSIQTMSILLGHEKMARLGVVAATKLQSVVLSRHVGVMVASKAATGGHILVTKAMTFALIRQTAATHGLTAATKLFMRAAWPLLAISAAISAAYLLYENNIGGLKDGIDSLMGTEKSHLDIMQEERDSVDGLTQSYDGLTNSIKKLSPVHEQYLTMMRDAAVNRGDQRLAASYQAQLQQPARQGFSSGVGSPSFGGTGGGSSGGYSSGGVSSGGVSSGGIIPSAYGATTNRKLQVNQNIPTSPTTVISNDPPDPFGSIMQQEMFKLLTPPEQMESLMQLSISEGLSGRQGSAEKYMQKAESMRYAAESWRPRGIETDPVKAFKAVENRNTSMKATDWNKRYFPTGMSSSLKFGGEGDGSGLAYYLQGRDKKFDPNAGREIFYAGTGGADIANWQRQGGGFGKDSPIMDLLGLRQAEGLSFEKRNTNLSRQNMVQFNAMNRERNVSSGAGFSQAAIAAGASATAQYQGGSVNWARKAEWKANLARVDAYVNSGAALAVSQGQNIFTSGGSGRSYGKIPGSFGTQNAIAKGSRSRMYARQFGSDLMAEEELAAAADLLLTGDHGDTTQRAGMFLVKATEIADRRIDRVESLLSQQLGLDFDVNSKEGFYTRYGGTKNRPLMSFTSTAKPMWEQIRDDIGASIDITLPSINVLEASAMTYKISGIKRTNFNNREIMTTARNKLNLSNSQIFAIRFDSTRGDTELQDRLRYVDQLEAMSSGTSPL